MKLAERVDPKSSHHKEKIFFFFSCLSCLWLHKNPSGDDGGRLPGTALGCTWDGGLGVTGGRLWKKKVVAASDPMALSLSGVSREGDIMGTPGCLGRGGCLGFTVCFSSSLLGLLTLEMGL